MTKVCYWRGLCPECDGHVVLKHAEDPCPHCGYEGHTWKTLGNLCQSPDAPQCILCLVLEKLLGVKGDKEPLPPPPPAV